jgi:tRNA modification GTPase
VPLLRVHSKADLGAGGPGGFPVSAATGQGVEGLRLAIVDRLQGDPLDPEELVVSQLRHRQLLETAREALERGVQGLVSGMDRSLLATDLRDAAVALGAIHGGFDVEDVLDGIFTKFCIGK